MEKTTKETYDFLTEGNRKYVLGSSRRPSISSEERLALVSGQQPYAIVLTCADSRVVPELIFNTGIGELFVIRVAGNILDDVVIASIEYAVANLKTNTVVILGHQNCGAVTAALDGAEEAHFPALVDKIAPAVAKAKMTGDDVLDSAIRLNAIGTAKELSATGPTVKERVQDGKLQILAAYYSLETGKVEFLDAVSDQS